MPKVFSPSYSVCFVLAGAIVWVLSYLIYQLAVSDGLRYHTPRSPIAIEVVASSKVRKQVSAHEAYAPVQPSVLPSASGADGAQVSAHEAHAPVQPPPRHGADGVADIHPRTSHDMLQYQPYHYHARSIPLHRVEPIYPPNAMTRGIEGEVEIEFILTRQGGVTNLQVVRSKPHSVFDEAALQAVSQWRYQPTAQEEKRKVIIEFRLNE